MADLEITPELAEIAGIHAGDGYLRYGGARREVDISGGFDEKEYYDEHVIPLFNSCFGLSIKGAFFPSRGTYGFKTYNRAPVSFLAQMGFPSGEKSTVVSVPKVILESDDECIIASFLRGYFDTDGSLTFDKKIGNSNIFQKTYNYYPRLMFCTCSWNLKEGFQELVRRLGLVCKVYTYKPKKQTENLKYKLQITGDLALRRWMAKIGSKNPSKISRYVVWKRFGFCPPNTTYQQRLDMLSGKLDPYSFHGPVA